MTAIGFVGTGNMGSAIIKGLADTDFAIHGYDLDTARLEKLADEAGLRPCGDVAELVRACDYIVLAVKPQQLKSLLKSLREELDETKRLVSIAAGVSLKQLVHWSGKRAPAVRIMPNTPALVSAGVTALCFDDERLTDEDKSVVRTLFEAVGEVHVLAEKDFDAFTALIGSGPAYVFYVLDALAEAGVNLGLPRQQALPMAISLMAGSAKLAAESGFSPSQLREMVTSPAGTTVKGLNELDFAAVRGAFIRAVEASYKRSIELGD